MILYLHGFRSSPESAKAQLLRAAAAGRGMHDFWAPQLPPSPREALALCMQGLKASLQSGQKIVLVGSSLGGYYAARLAGELQRPAVLINPVVHAVRDLSTQIGPAQGWHHPQQHFEFTAQHLKELHELQPRNVPLAQCLLLAGTADEVLDWQEMTQYCQGSRQLIAEGADHGFSPFEAYLPQVLEFIENAE